MSEAMALERLAEEWLRFQGFWTQTRVPFRLRGTAKKPLGSSSDLDVIGIRENEKGLDVVVVEVKGHGAPNVYPDYTRHGRGREIIKICKEKKKDVRIFERSVRKDWGIHRVNELRLVLGGKLVTAGDARRKLEHDLKHRYKLPFSVRIFSIDEMIRDLVECVRKDKDVRRKRYADSALEMIRWVLRSGGNICWPAGDGASRSSR